MSAFFHVVSRVMKLVVLDQTRSSAETCRPYGVALRNQLFCGYHIIVRVRFVALISCVILVDVSGNEDDLCFSTIPVETMRLWCKGCMLAHHFHWQ